MSYVLLLFGLLGVLNAVPLKAQALFVESSDPVEGETGVALEKRIHFHLNKPTPAFGSVFTTRFFWSPADSTALRLFGHDPPGPHDFGLRTIFFDLSHTPETDFSFFAYGIRAEDGSTMARPFALNYTTAAEAGRDHITGSVAFAKRAPQRNSSQRTVLLQSLREVLNSPSNLLPTPLPRKGDQARSLPDIRGASNLAALDLNKTIILLMERPVLAGKGRPIRAAAAIKEDGSFVFNHVREGTYYPVVINWADADGEIVAAYGFLDTDQDLEPEALHVNGPVEPLNLSLFPIEATTAAPLAALARKRAARLAPDQRLLEITAEQEAPEGVAKVWRYLFYSPSQDRLTSVHIDPINVVVDEQPLNEAGERILPTAFNRQQRPLPEAFVDSDRALQVAEAHGGATFRAQFADTTDVRVLLKGGDLELDERPAAGHLFWQVRYLGPTAKSDSLTVFIDMETGEVLEAVSVAREKTTVLPAQFTLHTNYPNPFNPTTTIRFEVTTPGRVRLDVFDLLGRRVVTLLDRSLKAGEHRVAWDGRNEAGERVATGSYVYRMVAGAFVSSRVMFLLK